MLHAEEFLDKLYEASALPHCWPSVLEGLATSFGAKGAILFTAEAGDARHATSPSLEQFCQDYIDEGWMRENKRGAPLVASLSPAFLTDTDVWPVHQLQKMPVYRDFLMPRGMEAGAGTVIQGAHHDLIVLTVEGFASHDAARSALPALNALRGHIGRALSLTSRVQLGRAEAMVDGLSKLGAAAAVTSREGHLRASNDAFLSCFGDLMIEHRSRLRFTERALDDAFGLALATAETLSLAPRSVPVRGKPDTPPCIVHLVPLRRGARALFEADGLLLLAANGKNKALPNADLLRLLFDLTPAEARLARLLLTGVTLQEAAASSSMAYSTGRVHLRSIFSKTGVRRQSELVQLLSGYGEIARDAPAGRTN